ncbi:MAG: thiolase [Actinobacteria bacterium RBG_19FT_COMBO_54_7]|uniref:Thiolase n=1 Tax=Candidatus Solincola sediminis TaxID=1797199 RepID=A0A1F2WF61_9ACTN|nr:MAG: thiolase [Candidatus Solincola sediminis]OFW57826.1 MAG: thiolase [Candidatus Solincola sediminis]OFW68569.1 MAG: thiolase [Actinobacteria bacterium RBG_19FT_COMBO_54_7]
MNDDVYILGIGMIRFKKYPEKSIKQLTAEAVQALRDDVQVDLKDIEAAWFSNSGWGMSQGQHCIRGQVALATLGLQGLPVTNVENACAGASTAVHAAWTAVKAGVYDLVLAVGAEKVWFPEDKQKMFEGFASGADVEFVHGMIAAFKADAAKKAKEAKEGGKEKEGGHSAFMDIYAMGARIHMKTYGTTQRQLAVIAAKNHTHGSMNPMAQYQMDMTVDEVLEDLKVAYPLTRAMCAPIGDGAAAALICSERGLKKFLQARPVRIRASVLASGSLPDSGLEGIGKRLSRRAYDVAALGPGDIDLVEVHDATAFGELLQYEELGFCPAGEGGPFAESGATKIGGSLPVNTSGGLECRGHPIGASGIAQLYELTIQLRGDAGARQVEGAKIGMAENGGGFIGIGEAAMCVHILEKV